MKLSLICALLLAFQCSAVAAQTQGALIKSDGDYDAGYRTGVSAADKELKEGLARLYTYGLRDEGVGLLDRKTGLPLKVIAGCAVDREIEGRAAGHNARVREYIADRGLPSNSFKRWEKQLFDLKGYYEERARTEKPHRLTPGDLAAECPDGIHALRVEKVQHREEDGALSVRSSVIISVGPVDHKALDHWIEGDMDLFWGPKGSGFAVIRCVEKQTRSFMALDLRRGKLLRWEYVSGPAGE
jgi:hypothetical protein